MKLYLDDIRFPKTDGWIIVRNYKQFVDWIQKNGLPDEISFDHDLADYHYGVEYTGYDCAKLICNYCLDNKLPIPDWNVHSANTIGKENIDSILKNYSKKLNNENIRR